MQNAFSLFDRDGDGTINAKVKSRLKISISCIISSMSSFPYQELGSVMKAMGLAPAEDTLQVTFKHSA